MGLDEGTGRLGKWGLVLSKGRYKKFISELRELRKLKPRFPNQGKEVNDKNFQIFWRIFCWYHKYLLIQIFKLLKLKHMHNFMPRLC